MAIQEKNTFGNGATEQKSNMGQAFAAAEQQQQQQNQPGGRQQNFSFRNMGGMMRAPMGRNPASEALSKMTKAMTDVYAANINSKLFEVSVLPIDMNANVDLDVSVIVVVARDREKMEQLAFHTLLVGASIPTPASKFEVINEVNTEVVRVVGDAYTDKMLRVVRDTLGKNFPNCNQNSAGSCVVPADFNILDTDAVFSLASNAAYAVCSSLEMLRPDFIDINLHNAQNDSSLGVAIKFHNPEIIDRAGQPMRSDIVIDFTAGQQNQQQNTTGVERVNSIGQIAGFVDLVWNPVAQQQNMYYQPTQQQSFQKYSPRFVCTKMESTEMLTIPAQLLALLPALSLNENGGCQWVRQFDRKNFHDGVDWQDIGVVAIEANLENDPSGIGQRVKTKSDSFKTEHLYKLIAATVRPGLILSMDVPECGPETWYNDVFAAAAEGSEKANAAIIRAGNFLTNGCLSKYFGGGRVAVDEFNRIHLGSYLGSDGIRHDIRNIDYLAVANAVGDKDISIVRDWSDTFLKTNYGQKLRLHGRKKIMEQMVTDLRITGFARRVTFEESFTTALYKAAVECGLCIRSTTAFNDIGSYERATADFLSSAVMNSTNNGLFNRGGFSNNMGGNNNRTFGGRWL